MPIWSEDIGITWENADDKVKTDFALVRLFWFYRMVQNGGPDGSELDDEVAEQAREAAAWFGPILAKMAEEV